MNTTNQAPGSQSGSSRSVWITFTLFFITVVALAVVIYLIVQPSEQQREVILNLVESAPEAAPEVNVGSIIDLSEQPDAAVVLGGRYRVQIRENSRDGSSGMVRIGGMITFVDGAAAGDDAVIEVTRVRATTAQAVALSVESGKAVSAPAPRPGPVTAPRSPSFSSGGLVGGVLTGVVSYIGSRGDGAVKINGKPVYVKGANEVNQQVVFRVSREEDAYAVGDLVTVLSTDAAPEASTPVIATVDEPAPAMGEDGRPVKAPHIQVGMTYETEVTGVDRFNEANGMTRIDDLVVIIPDTKVGDRVKIEITERKNRYAVSRVIESLDSTPAE